LHRDLAALVAMPTGFNHAAGLDAARRWFAERLDFLGAMIEIVPGDPRPRWLDVVLTPDEGGAETGSVPPTLIARRRVNDGRAAVRPLLCGHLDTVHDPHGAFRSLSEPVDGIAHGPGAMDMKGGLVVALAALEALESVGRRIDWSMVLVSDEETGTWFGHRALVSAVEGHDVGLVFEPMPAAGGLVVERMGSGTFMIEARGRSAHVGRAFADGRSAVVALARAIVAVSDLAAPESGRIVNVGPVHGGAAANAVPHHARCWGNVRYADDAARASLEAALREVVEGLNRRFAEETDDPVVLRLETGFLRGAKPRTPESLALAERVRSVSLDLGEDLPFVSTGGACDGNDLQAAGLPTIDTLGVRGGGMHRPDEHVDLASLVERATLVAILLHRLDRDGFGERPGSDRPIP
jgi:glutamate carboxypeptidase